MKYGKVYYNEEIIFYSNPNNKKPNISVGFQKDYVLYPLNSFGIISKDEALESNYEGFSVVESIKKSDADESYIVVAYGMYDLMWDGFYPYDLNGDEIIYESKDGGIDLFKDDKVTKISESSRIKYKEMKDRIPNIKFKISSGRKKNL